MKSLTKRIKKFCFVLYTLMVLAFISINFFISYLSLPFEHLDNYQQSILIKDQNENILFRQTNTNGDYCLPQKNKFQKNIYQALIAIEDKRFYIHPGIDFIATTRAIASNLFAQKRISGASTITMQCIRMKTENKRTYFNKIKEALYAGKLERKYSKDEIIHAYLNMAPYCGNIYGFEAASYYYFSKPSRNLSIAEIALLTAIPQAPTLLRPDQNFNRCSIRKNKILYKMHEIGAIDSTTLEKAKNEIITLKIMKTNPYFPNSLGYSLVTSDYEGSIKTTIDLDLQKKLYNETNRYFKFNKINIECSVIVMDGTTGYVKALIDLNNNKEISYLSATCLKRSPASLLKPFLYALGAQKHIIWPEKQLSDDPINFSGYTPQNNDKINYTKIKMKDALRYSRNTPAVSLLKEIGIKSFSDELNNLGMNNSNDFQKSGLTLALGSTPVSFLKLISAYSVFINNGCVIRPSFIENNVTKKRIFSDDAIQMILDCFITDSNGTYKAKTGTSWGPRDAWCIGFNNKYIVGVWLGNLSGGTIVDMSGPNSALPILESIFYHVLPQNSKAENQNLLTSYCSETGYLASSNCTKTYLAKKYNTIKNIPICNHSTLTTIKEKTAKITSPASNQTYLFPGYNSSAIIKCELNSNKDKLNWYVNGSFHSTANNIILQSKDLSKGSNTLSVFKNNDFVDDVVFIVEK